MEAALQHFAFDCTVARPPATPLRQESLGGFAAGGSAISTGGFALSPLFWEELQGRRWLFTYDSALLLGGSVDAFFAHMSSDGSSPGGGPAMDCQFTSSVIVLALAGHTPGSTGVSLCAAKLALNSNRVLVVYSDDPSAPPALRLTSTYGRRLIGAAAPCTAAASSAGDEAAAFASAAGRLDAFLDWLRHSMGAARARLPPPPPDAESPSVVASVRSSGGAGRQLTASVFAVGASGAPPLIVAPAALRRLLNRGGPVPAPAPVPASFSAAPPAAAAVGGAGAGGAGDAAAAVSGIGSKRSRGAYEAEATAAGSSAAADGLGSGSGSGSGSSAGAASALAGAGAAPSAASGSGSAGVGVSLAIIVPYRNQPAQNRELQLRLFAEYMPRFLARMCPTALAALVAGGSSAGSAGGASAGASAGAAGGAGAAASSSASASASSLAPLPHRIDDFHVIIVEQSEDGHKFNRGKLLNIGFAIASSPARAAAVGLGGRRPFTSFCFHDVDLLPQDALARWYASYPVRPIHIAAAWPRYFERNKSYVGGITSFAGPDFARINGFPNNFWGWGAEDDELRDRMERGGLFPPERPPEELSGCIRDLEDEFKGKRASLRVQDGGVAEWRCTWRKELRAYHVKTGHTNGLSTLRYRTVGHRAMGDRVTVVTVDLLGDWDAAAKFDEDNYGQQVTAATTSKFIEQMLASETERGSGLLRGAPEGDKL